MHELFYDGEITFGPNMSAEKGDAPDTWLLLFAQEGLVLARWSESNHCFIGSDLTKIEARCSGKTRYVDTGCMTLAKYYSKFNNYASKRDDITEYTERLLQLAGYDLSIINRGTAAYRKINNLCAEIFEAGIESALKKLANDHE